MAERGNMLTGIAVGAGLMYLFDPNRGKRRRAMVRDQLVRSWNQLDDATDVALRDLKNRAEGMAAEVRSRLTGEEIGPEVLEARVRAAIGRAVRHPHGITVEVEGDRVMLRGPVLTDEVDDLIAAVESVRGVSAVENHLEVHDSPEGVPGLQGGGRRPVPKMDVLQENWAPGTRLLMGLGGGLLALYGRRARGPIGLAASILGTGVLARAVTNMDIARLTGVGAGRRAVDIQKAINVNAPVDEVFELWSHPENFPKFMAHLKEVRPIGDNRYHWVAEGPAGSTIEWDAEITQFVPNEVIAWKSDEGATVANAGIIRFQPNEQGGTRIDIKLHYNPPGGAIGHVVASFFGVDPKRAMDEDLVRLKSLIEDGRTTAHGRMVRREDLVMGTRPFEAGGIA